MWDSISHAAIPEDADTVAVYDDGWLYGPRNPAAWPQWAVDALTARGVQVVHITVTGETLTAAWGDCEWGDMDEQQVAAWRARQAAAGRPQGGVYASLSRLGAVVAACGPCKLWSAHYTGVAHICGEACGLSPDIAALVVGTQYIDHGPFGENYDLSLIQSNF